MSKRFLSSVMAGMVLVGCAPTRQLAVDYPASQTNQSSDPQAVQATQSVPFAPVSGFSAIDGDDYYVRLISEFEFKGDNVLKQGCSSMTPSYEKSDLSSSLLFSIKNEVVKFTNEVPGFVYQSATGKCNFKFDAKKTVLTPWIRLDSGKETEVDYSFITSANSNVDMNGLAGDVTTASNLLALTGVGMGAAVVGQFAGQWAKNTPAASASAPKSTLKQSSESHSLPALVDFSGNTGTLKKTSFKVFAVAEGGVNVFSSDTQPLGELKIYPELTPSLLLKTTSTGVPQAADLSVDELSNTPIKAAGGQMTVALLMEQSKYPAKPNLKPDWSHYDEVEGSCRKMKLMLKDLGFNKFDRDAYLYYFLESSVDWKNYNTPTSKLAEVGLTSQQLSDYQHKNFAGCLQADDYAVMKVLGLSVNGPADWQQIQALGQKKAQFLAPLKAIERQFASVLSNPKKAEIESQLYPLLATAGQGDGTVLLQNYLGDFGLEKLLATPAAGVSSVPVATANPVVVNTSANTEGVVLSGQAVATVPSVPVGQAIPASEGTVLASVPVSVTTPAPVTIPGGGLIVTAKQLAQVIVGLNFKEFSCARLLVDQQGQVQANNGFVLFTTQPNSPRGKGGALEFEFTAGKINRIAFQLPTYKDFEQTALSHPVQDECKIELGFISQLH